MSRAVCVKQVEDKHPHPPLSHAEKMRGRGQRLFFACGNSWAAGGARAERYAICVDNTAYPASLELRKIYRVVPDPDAAQDGARRGE